MHLHKINTAYYVKKQICDAYMLGIQLWSSLTINSVVKISQPKWSKCIGRQEILICPCAAVMATVKALGDPFQGYDTNLVGQVRVSSRYDGLIWYHVWEGGKESMKIIFISDQAYKHNIE